MNQFFILGCHRSGTTLLQQILNRHSAVAIPPETKFFSSFIGHTRPCQRRRLDKINQDLGIDVPFPSSAIVDKHRARVLFEEIRYAYLKRLTKPNVTLFGEKTPSHTGFFGDIHLMFPNARFVWIYRDGRDVALSMSKVSWLSRNLMANFLIWLFYYRCQSLAEASNASILFIKYESLVTNPVSECRRLTNFLGLRFEESLVSGNNSSVGILEWELPWKHLATQPINDERHGIWRRELKVKDIELLEWLGKSALSRLGYDLSTRPVWWHQLGRMPRGIVDLGRLMMKLPLTDLWRQVLVAPLWRC